MLPACKSRPTKPTVEEPPALGALYKTSPFKVNGERLAALDKIQSLADAFECDKFKAYCREAECGRQPGGEIPEIMRNAEFALDKIIWSMENLPKPERGARLFLLYNMGYVIQTPTAAFAVDTVHPRVEMLAPRLDFLLLTHRHTDHYSQRLVSAMGEKPVVSNFISNRHKHVYDEQFYEFGKISVRATIAHHGKTTPRFVSVYEISCDDSETRPRILHAGDAGKWEQIKPQKAPDVFIPHVSVGLDIRKCADETVKPKLVLMSHLLEMAHPTYKWRHPLKLGLKKCGQIKNATAIMPFWGERVDLA